LLAVLPILGVTLLMGGVTGAQFWKTTLALVNALLLSLAVGLFVSAMSRDSQKAMAATLSVVLMLALVGPVLEGIARLNGGRFNPVLSLTSPGYVFVTASAWGRTPFWTGLLVNQIVAWTFLGLSCVLLPRTWQQKTKIPSIRSNSEFPEARAGTASRRRKLVSINPVLWLAARERWPGAVTWILALLTMIAALITLAKASLSSGAWMVWSYSGGMVTLGLYLAIASHACRFFVEANRSGLIELLLATPLAAKQIVLGQWRALVRLFAAPLAVYLAAQLLAAVMTQMSWSRMTAATTATTVTPATTATTTTNTTGSTSAVVGVTNTIVVSTTGAGTRVAAAGWAGPNQFVIVTAALLSILTTAANFVALMWFGMWMGLNSRTNHIATLKTLLFVQIIPWFAVTFASWMLVPLLLFGSRGGSMAFMAWYPLLMSAIPALLYLAKDVGFVVWTRRKLYGEFRERASRGWAPVTQFIPAAPSAVPPVIIAK
jgi:hypothetical protein